MLVKSRLYIKYTTKEGDLLVFSQSSGRLYGFDQFGSSLFSFLESDRNAEKELLQCAKDNDNLKSIVKSIIKILDDNEEKDESSFDVYKVEYPLELDSIESKNPFYYQLDDFVFVIDTDDMLIIKTVLPTLAHLRCEDSPQNQPSLNINLKKVENNKWFIYFNGKVVYKDLELEALLPRLLDYIRIAYYHTTDYIISLHSAALYVDEIPLILPAVSGSGKSTLSAYMMEKGCSFLTDEVVLIDKDECIKPIPMSITLKEGSWKVLEDVGISFDNLLVHKRFDGQKLHFLPPKNISEKSLKVTNAFLIFPKYQEGVQTEIKELSTLEVLAYITSSGYEVMDSYNWSNIHRWIKLLEGFQKFAITYSSLEDAYLNIKRLIDHEIVL